MSLKKKPKEDDHEALAEEDAVTDGQNYVLVPPDGGWGWLVLLGSTLVNMLIPGTLKSFGVLFVEFTEAFHASETAASWIPAICYFLYCSLGPVSSYLSSIYSYRTVTLIGGTLASLGLMLCYFADSITFLYFSYGVLFGCGAGLAFPPGIFIVTSYFVKYRGFANGVAISGSCLGSMFLPPFLGYLIDNYGYKDVVLILGALTLNVWVGALLYHPVERHMVKRYVDDDEYYYDEYAEEGGPDSGGEADALSTVSAAAAVQPAAGGYGGGGLLHVPVSGGKSLTELRCEDAYADDDGRLQETVSLLAQNLNGYVIVNELNASSVKMPADDRYLLAGGGVAIIAAVNSKSARAAAGSPMMAFSSCSLLRTTGGGGGGGAGGGGGGANGHANHQHQRLGASKTCVNGCASLSSLRYVSTPFHGSTLVSLYEESQPKQPRQLQQNKGHELQTTKGGGANGASSPLQGAQSSRRKTVAGALQLLSDPLFIVILVSNATTAIGYTNSAILLPSYAISVGHDKSSSQYLLSVVAVLDLVGRIGGSTLSDWIRLDKRYYYLTGLVLSGVSLFVLPFADDYPTMCCVCASFGLGSGVVVGITAVIMVDMLGEERLASSYGISLLCNGLMQLIGPPVAGYIFETIGSYRPVFHGMGIILLFGASAWLITPFLKKNHYLQQQQQQQQQQHHQHERGL